MDHVHPMLPVVSTILLWDKKHISLGFPCEPHLYLNSANLSEISVWIMGAPCFYNLSWLFVFLSTTWKLIVYRLKQSRSCEFSQFTGHGLVEMKELNGMHCYVSSVAALSSKEPVGIKSRQSVKIWWWVCF